MAGPCRRCGGESKWMCPECTAHLRAMTPAEIAPPTLTAADFLPEWTIERNASDPPRSLVHEHKEPPPVLVELYMSECMGLIVKAPTGVVYGNQVGGTACGQPQTEGLYVPLGSDDRIKEDPLLNLWDEPWDEDIAARVRKLLDTCYSDQHTETLSEWLEPDPEGGPVSEAWVPVRIKADAKHPPAAVENLLGRRAILTYGNSD